MLMSPDPIVRAAEFVEGLHELTRDGLIVFPIGGPIQFPQPDNERVKEWQKCKGQFSQDTLDRGWLLFCIGQESRAVAVSHGGDSDKFTRLANLAFSIETMTKAQVKELLGFYLDDSNGKPKQ
jgi:hypothetical protein